MAEHKKIYQALQIRVEFEKAIPADNAEDRDRYIQEQGQKFDRQLQEHISKNFEDENVKVQLLWKQSRWGSLINDCVLVYESAASAGELTFALYKIVEIIRSTAHNYFKNQFKNVDIRVAKPSWHDVNIEAFSNAEFHAPQEEDFSSLWHRTWFKNNWSNLLWVLLALLFFAYLLMDKFSGERRIERLEQQLQKVEQHVLDSAANPQTIHSTPIIIPEKFTLAFQTNAQEVGEDNTSPATEISSSAIAPKIAPQIQEENNQEDTDTPRVYRVN